MAIQLILYEYKFMDKDQIKSLIKSQKSNYSLDQKFYVYEIIFKLDLENFFFKQWIFVGHVSRNEKGRNQKFNYEAEN